jgi:hypothetical protein
MCICGVQCASVPVCACAACAVLCECVWWCEVRVVCVAVTTVQWVCEPWWVASAVAAVVSGREYNSSMRGSAVWTPAVVVRGDARACVQIPHLTQQPDQRQLSVGGVRAVVVAVRAMSAACVCFCVGCAVCMCGTAHDVRCMCGALFFR